ncbi:putative centrin-1 [Gregarina niphandrodes]|uniref:Centrin-1 n=1 Tax=Gregarina niphandrodes TaxID=110365 RepID=A0A023B1U0_GRENI|nr:putative centrin-1 [Gregarina niphandrodes]EZG46752.1 putative centrin-1 [Gregarina niphandrodes]|eukprot:XP_011132261.1 putative centrin-1 [Gregarina niphandrodes]
MNRYDLQDIEDVFKFLDMDNEGVITRNEALVGLAALDCTVSLSEVAAYVECGDPEPAVTRRVFENLARQYMPPSQSKENIVRAFRLLDDGNKGYITAEDIARKVNELGCQNIGDDDIIRMVARAVEEGTVVTEDAFVQVISQSFSYWERGDKGF